MLIGVSGKAGSGKDTVGMYLQALSMEEECIGGYWATKPIEYAKSYETRPNLKGGWRIVKFADKLKRFCADLLSVQVEKFEDRTFKESELPSEWIRFLKIMDQGKIVTVDERMTGRDLLRAVGIGLRDTVHERIWINGLFVDYKGFEHKGVQIYPNWIITDLRFPNELQEVKVRNGISVRIERPGIHVSSNYSETALDDAEFDHIIINDGTQEELLEKVENIYNMYKK
jgi:hypothetical protein